MTIEKQLADALRYLSDTLEDMIGRGHIPDYPKLTIANAGAITALRAYDARPVADESEVERVAVAIASELSAGRYFHALYNAREEDAASALKQAARAAIAALQGDGWRELRALNEKATQGEWLNGYYGHHDATGRMVITGYSVEANTPTDPPVRNFIADNITSASDAAFIVACVNHVRAALNDKGGDNG